MDDPERRVDDDTRFTSAILLLLWAADDRDVDVEMKGVCAPVADPIAARKVSRSRASRGMD